MFSYLLTTTLITFDVHVSAANNHNVRKLLEIINIKWGSHFTFSFPLDEFLTGYGLSVLVSITLAVNQLHAASNYSKTLWVCGNLLFVRKGDDIFTNPTFPRLFALNK